MWRVMLWYSNPCRHGRWVEASITNGEPSQKDKVHGGEHPCGWSRSKPAAQQSRQSHGRGVIDAFSTRGCPSLPTKSATLARARNTASMRR